MRVCVLHYVKVQNTLYMKYTMYTEYEHMNKIYIMGGREPYLYKNGCCM